MIDVTAWPGFPGRCQHGVRKCFGSDRTILPQLAGKGELERPQRSGSQSLTETRLCTLADEKAGTKEVHRLQRQGADCFLELAFDALVEVARFRIRADRGDQHELFRAGG